MMASATAIVLTTIMAGDVQAASYGYAFQNTSGFTFSGASIGTLTTQTSTSAQSAAGAIPSGLAGDIEPMDALQAYVGNPPVPGQNVFTPVGPSNPDYARGDVLITPAFSISNVAEGFLTPPGAATATSAWTVSAPITLSASGTVTLGFNFSNALNVSLTDGPGLASANYSFNFTIADSGGTTVLFSSAPTTVNNSVSLTLPGSINIPTSTGTVSITSSTLAAGTYIASISGSETIDIRQTAIPEPSSVVLLGSGLAIGLGCCVRRIRQAHSAA